MTDKPLSWWLELGIETARSSAASCRTCGTESDSVDAFCLVDGASLLGSLLSERSLYYLMYVLRGIVVGAAIAVGYFRLASAAYIASAFIACVFASIFVRRHRLPLNYFIATFSAVAIGFALWRAVDMPFGRQILTGIFVVTVICELLILASAIKALLPDSDGSVLEMRPWTAITACAGMTTVVACLCTLALARFFPSAVLGEILWIVRYTVSLAASVSAGALLIASIAYTLNAPAFPVPDVLAYKPLLKATTLRRLTLGRRLVRQGYGDVIANAVERAFTFFANGLIAAVEQTYNQQIRLIINGRWRAAIAVGNAANRAVTKAFRHIDRTVRRWGALAKDCCELSFLVAWRYTLVFFLPVAVSVGAAWQLWTISIVLNAYIAREAAWYAPLGILLGWLMAACALALVTMLPLGISVGRAFVKFVAAAIPIGSNGFFFFVLVAWTLGLIGMFTDGPYRIGWVTVVSTLAIGGVLIRAYGRRGVASPPGS